MKIEKFYNVCTSAGIYIDGISISEINKEKLNNIILNALENNLIDYENFFEYCIDSEDEDTENVECEICGTGFITTINIALGKNS